MVIGADQVLQVTVPMLGAVEAVSALGACLRLRIGEGAADPELGARLDAVLDALDVRDAVDGLQAQQSVALLGLLEGFLTQATDFVGRPDRAGWDYEQPSILRAQGHSSVLVATALQRFVVPSIGDDLAARLVDGDAWFLDVGSGVAALSIAMCRLWPSLRVVGVDSWPPALTLAREAVADAGVQERVELREGTVEALDDSDRFDLAWLPTFFIARSVLRPAVERVYRAMRVGGWVTLGLYARPGDRLADALADLRTVRQGGTLMTPPQAAELLERVGFDDVGVHFDPVWKLPIVFVAGRRPGP